MTDAEALQSAKEAFIDFAAAVLKLLLTWANSDPPPTYVYPGLDFRDDGTVVPVTRTRADYVALVFGHDVEVATMPQAYPCLVAQQKAGILPADAMSVHHLLWPVLSALEHRGDLHPTIVDLGAAYERFREVWTQGVSCDLTVPLFGLNSDIARDESLATRLVIGPLSVSEKNKAWDFVAWMHHKLTDPPPIGGWTFAGAAIRLSGVIKEGKPGDDIAARADEWAATYDELGRVVSAIRLLRPGDISAPLAFSKPREIVEARTGAGWRKLPYPICGGRGDGQLLAADLPALKQLVRDLGDSVVRHELAVALRRFNQSYERTLPEDRIIDLMIALDSTLLYGPQGSSAKRLAERGSKLLRPLRNRNNNFNLLYALYNIRNFIVHEGETISRIPSRTTLKNEHMGTLLGAVNPPLQTDGLHCRCEDIVRSAIREYVTRIVSSPGATLATINQALDLMP